MKVTNQVTGDVEAHMKGGTVRSLSFDQRSRFLLSGGEKRSKTQLNCSFEVFNLFVFIPEISAPFFWSAKCAIFVTHLAFQDCLQLLPVFFSDDFSFQRHFQLISVQAMITDF